MKSQSLSIHEAYHHALELGFDEVTTIPQPDGLMKVEGIRHGYRYSWNFELGFWQQQELNEKNT